MTARSSSPDRRCRWGVISLVVDELDLDEFRAKLREQIPEAEDAAMTIAEQMLNRGRAEGREEGRERGQVEGLVQVLTKQLVLKFGAIGADSESRIRTATPAELDRYVERVLTAATLAAVFSE